MSMDMGVGVWTARGPLLLGRVVPFASVSCVAPFGLVVDEEEEDVAFAADGGSGSGSGERGALALPLPLLSFFFPPFSLAAAAAAEVCLDRFAELGESAEGVSSAGRLRVSVIFSMRV